MASDQMKMPWARWTAIDAAAEIGCSPATVRRRLIARGLMGEGQSISHIAIDQAMIDAIRERSPRIPAPAGVAAQQGVPSAAVSSANSAPGRDHALGALFGGGE